MEKRKHPRTALSLPVLLRFGHDLGHGYNAALVNYSEGGARFTLTPTRALQDKVDGAVVWCEVGSLRLIGEARWSKLNALKRELDLGVRFVGATATDLAALARGGAPPKKRPIALILLLLVAAWATWLSLDRTAQIAEVTRLKGELDAAEESKQSLSRRLRAAEERTRAQRMAPVAEAPPPATPPPPPPPLPRPEHVNPQPPPASTNDDPEAPPEPDNRQSL